MTVIQIGCSQLGLANWVQQIVTGGIIVVAPSRSIADAIGARMKVQREAKPEGLRTGAGR